MLSHVIINLKNLQASDNSKGADEMSIQSIKVENFTVFDKVSIPFSPGVNLFIGENGTGKTHLLKILYAVAKTEINSQTSLLDSIVNGKYVYANNTYAHECNPYFRDLKNNPIIESFDELMNEVFNHNLGD